MSITVIPAYRVIKRFVTDVADMPRDAALDSLEANVTTYVQHLLSACDTAFADLGRRTAVTQIGDPDLDALGLALDEIDAAKARDLIGQTLQRCGQVLPSPDLAARVILLPGDGQSRTLTSTMEGVIGLSLGAQATLLFAWPTTNWKQWLAFTVSHEYAHLVRNLLFPRRVQGGKLVYQKSQEPETLLDAMVAEGISDAFAMTLHPDMAPSWATAVSSESEQRAWPGIRRRLAVSDMSEIRRFLFGDGDRIPLWAGTAIGYRIVRGYLDRRPATEPANLVGLSARVILEASGYPPPADQGPKVVAYGGEELPDAVQGGLGW